MKVRTSIIAAGAAVVLGTTGALVVPTVASAHSAAPTLKFISVQKATLLFTKTRAPQDTDVDARARPSASTCSTSRSPRRPPRPRTSPATPRRLPVRHGHRQPQDWRDHQRQSDRRDRRVPGATGTIRVKAISKHQARRHHHLQRLARPGSLAKGGTVPVAGTAPPLAGRASRGVASGYGPPGHSPGTAAPGTPGPARARSGRSSPMPLSRARPRAGRVVHPWTDELRAKEA